MANSTSFAVPVLLAMLAVPVPTQQPIPRTTGGFYVQYAWGASQGDVRQVNTGTSTPTESRSFEWLDYSGSSETPTTVQMPFDAPGGCAYVGDGHFLVTGKDVTTGNGYVLRVSLVTTPQRQVVIDESMTLSGYDPMALFYDEASQAIFLWDPWSMLVKRGEWANWGLFPAAFTAIADASSFPGAPFVISGPQEPGEVSGSIYLRYEENGIVNRDRKLRVYQDSPTTWAVENLSIVRPTASTGWRVRRSNAVPHEGVMEVANATGGPFGIIDAETQQSVFQGSIPGPGWWPITVPSGVLVVGKRYYLSDGGTSPNSKLFEPTFRFGGATTADGYTMRQGWYRPNTMLIGNALFMVFGDLRWTGGGAVPGAALPVYLWAAAEEPSPQSVTTLPGGQVVLAHPTAMFTYEAAIPPHETFGIPMFVPIPVPQNDSLQGQAMLWQWFAVTPAQNIIISDVFGSRIKAPPATQSATGSTPTEEERTRMATAWLRSIAGPQDVRREYAAFLARLRTR